MCEAVGALVQAKYKPYDKQAALSLVSLLHLHQNEIPLASSGSLAEALKNLGCIPQLRGQLSNDWLSFASKVIQET